jgi:GDPmannose 4,6-dehydratase
MYSDDEEQFKNNLMKKVAIITGITGQDGAYLAKLLLDKGYEVTGLTRSYSNINLRGLTFLGIKDYVKLIECDLTDLSQVISVIKEVSPDHVYNLAAQSSVSLSFKQPIGTLNFNITSVLNLLEAIRLIKPDVKYYQASSSEIFGATNDLPITENHTINPISPYSISKATGFLITKNYREAYGIFSCNGFLFNHESCLRTNNYFVKKVITESLKIKQGKTKTLAVGNIDVKRDFGWAAKYVHSMFLMLTHTEPGDYIICSGTSISLRSIIEYVFKSLDISMDHLAVNKDLYRPTEIANMYGDNTEAKKTLGWDYSMSFYDVLDILIEEEIKYFPDNK